MQFDLSNTQHKFDGGVPSFELKEVNQYELLNKMTSFIQGIRVHEKNTAPFSKRSIHEIFDVIENEYTSILNQDVIENLFSFQKGMTGSASNNITALDFKYRQFTLEKHSDYVFTENTNFQGDMKKSLLKKITV
ncbi:Uncharacterized protein FWK35_00005325 [Aphis craccivora]|uniref:Uncharacterized protein n=1 Tax=Aphis craccivora TaxID=307492 RepID=A0A6G0YHA9_APHCR|nr:Uncharacterized protein FWK35_00005325 [Aphis craccivora]